MRKTLGYCRKNKKLLLVAVLLAVIIHGAYLRFHDLGAQSLWLDEGFSAQRATAILKHGYPLLDNGKISKSYLPVHYLMALGLALFDEMHFALRFFPALAGVLLIPIFYLFNRRVTSSWIQALLASCVISFMTYEVVWSRQARMYMILQASGMAAIWAFIAFIQEKKLKHLCLTVVFTLITIFSHPSGYIYPFACLLIALPEVRNVKQWREWVTSSVKHKVACGVLLCGGVGAFMFASGAGIDVFSITKVLATQESHSYGKLYHAFLKKEFGPVLWLSLAGMPVVCWKYRRYGMPLVIVTGLFFYYISYHSFLYHQRYIMPILPFIIAFAVMGPWAIASSIWKKEGRNAKIAATVLACACMVPFIFMRCNVKPYDRYMLGITAPQPDWRAAYKHVAEDSSKRGVREISTVSAYPMFHDLYLGNRGNKYFLPITLTGRKADVHKEASSSSAKVINSLNDLKDIRGYVLLDEMALGMLYHDEMRKVFRGVQPDKIIPGKFRVFIWYIPPRNIVPAP